MLPGVGFTARWADLSPFDAVWRTVSAGTVSLVLLVAGTLGIVARSVTFYRVTIPENHGSNPGFGAYEVTVIPWWLLVCVGVGMRTSLLIGWVSFVVGAFGLGFFGTVLAIVFRRMH